MKTRNVFYTSLILLLTFNACSPPDEGVGKISGSLIFESADNELEVPIYIQNAKVVLCKLSEEAQIPDGPSVSGRNKNDAELFGKLLAEPSTLTDSSGNFMLNNVLCGTYLVLFHLYPQKIEGTDWHDGILTEAYLDMGDSRIPPTNQAGFWEEGGMAAVDANWSSEHGLTAIKGNACSEKWGFCFTIMDEKAYPIVEVVKDSTVNVKLVTYFLPKADDK